MKSGDNMKTPEARVRQGRIMRERNKDNWFRMRAGFLLPHERRRIERMIQHNVNMTDIATAYGKHPSTICGIAKAIGHHRRSRGGV